MLQKIKFSLLIVLTFIMSLVMTATTTMDYFICKNYYFYTTI